MMIFLIDNALVISAVINLAIFFGLLEMSWKLIVLWRSGENGITAAMTQERLALTIIWAGSVVDRIQNLSALGMNNDISMWRLVLLIFNIIISIWLLLSLVNLKAKLNGAD